MDPNRVSNNHNSFLKFLVEFIDPQTHDISLQLVQFQDPVSSVSAANYNPSSFQSYSQKKSSIVNPFAAQVTAPKKKPKKPKAEEEKGSEEVVPETWTQKAASQLGELLQRSSSARTASIKLANMEYASELSAQLLEHAQQLEKLYQDLSKAITDNADDKSLRKLVSKSLKLEEFGIKAQVGIAHQENGLVLYIILYVTKKV